MPPLSFPISSTPGRLSGEGEGRLLNCYVEKSGDSIYVRRVPGLLQFSTAGVINPRGMIEVDGAINVAYSGAIVRFTSVGGAIVLTGSLPGTDGVTFARNNRVTAGGPDIIAVRETGGAFNVSAGGGGVTPLVAANLPSNVNSVTTGNGYFFFSIPDGKIYASDLNSTTVDALSFATAESRPDGLKRVIWHGGVLYALGSDTIEPWLDVGNSPFPLVRGTSVIPVGLLTTMAVAGYEAGWDHNPYLVSHDHTVRELAGYTAIKVSTPAVESFIASSTISSLEACVFVSRGRSFWALSSNLGTWVYDVLGQAWHERLSVGLTRWRGSRSVKAFDAWFVGDRLSGRLLALNDTEQTEATAALDATIESAALKAFPARMTIPDLFLDFTYSPASTVAVFWSVDGGQTWKGPISRSLAFANKFPVRVNRLGLATHHGLRVRLVVSGGQPFSFMGGTVGEPQARAA